MPIILKSTGDDNIEVSEEGCKKSGYLQRLIEGGKTTINLEEIKPDLLKKIGDYLNYYADKEFPTFPEELKSNNLKAEIDEWDFDFIDPISYENCFHLINAGLLLELNHLYELACAKIAAFMKGKSPEEVNEEFTIECQLTNEEAKKLGLDYN